MTLQSMYITYLQQLLNGNNIPFQTQEQFIKQSQQTGSKNEAKGNAKGPLKTNLKEPLTGQLIQRYSRQMLLKQIAYEGQTNIVNAKIAIIGSGGIGCPVALYLAAAGVGTLGLFDSDKVDVTNLHRQIGHRTSTVGTEKTTSLKSTLLDINPFINIKEHPFITAHNANTLEEYDLVIDGSDNPTCRYIVNDYCMKRQRKLLSGACIGWQAQITCYGGCLWGNEQVSIGGCSTLGVVGMLPGLVGMIVAIQAIKLIINGQSSLEGKLLTFDGRKCQFKKVLLRKKQMECIGCGENKLEMETYDYAKYATCAKSVPPEVRQISWQQFIEKHKNSVILDVRPSNIYAIVHFANSLNIPYEQLNKLSKEQILSSLKISESSQEQIAVSCARGVMSRHASKYLTSLGIPSFSIVGGINGYRGLFDSSIPEL